MNDISNQIPNKIILSKYSTSASQRRVIYAILMQIEKTMEFTLPDRDPVFDIPKSIILDGYSFSTLKKVCQDLIEKSIAIKDNEETEEFDVIAPFRRITVTKESSNIRAVLDRDIAKIFYEIKKGYSKIDYQSALALESKYAQKLYEIFSMKINGFDDDETAVWFTNIDELKEMLNIQNKYAQGSHFRQRVLEIAQKEINENTDLEIIFELKKKGRSLHDIDFYIKRKTKNTNFEIVEITLKDDKSKRCLKALIDLGVFDKKLQKTIIEQHQQAFWRWNHAVKIGAIKPKVNHAGHLLKTLGLK